MNRSTEPTPSPEGDSAPAPEAQEIKVVDRRWWARGEVPEGADEVPSLKPTYVEELEGRLAEKDRLLQGYIQQHKEAAREFEESRARLRREVAKDVERGRRLVLAELLDVMDNLDRAVEAGRSSAAHESLLAGVELVRRQFLAKLEAFGVKRLDSLGARFDPALHEAVSAVPVQPPGQDGVIVGVVREGYLVGDEVLRPAMVAVAREEA